MKAQEIGREDYEKFLKKHPYNGNKRTAVYPVDMRIVRKASDSELRWSEVANVDVPARHGRQNKYLVWERTDIEERDW